MLGSISDGFCINTWSTHRVCQGFRTAKVASKRGVPLTWLKYIPCITVVCHFLVATYECAWTGSGLAVFSICWCLILYFLAISQHLRETKLTKGHPQPCGGWPIAQGLLHLLCLQVLTTMRREVKVTCRNSQVLRFPLLVLQQATHT